jgi:hypothetical protein
MYFVTGEIHGGEQNVRYKSYAVAVGVAKKLRNGVVKDEDGLIVFPTAPKTTPRWIQNPRYWTEEVRIVKTLPGVVDEEDYRESKRATYLTYTDLLLDVASAIWTEHNGQIPANYWVRHKVGPQGFRDVNDNRLCNLELTLARNFYDYRLPVNAMPGGLTPLSLTKFNEWFHYDEETGVLFSRRPYISVYGVRDMTNKRPVVRERSGGYYYDIATTCYISVNGRVPPLMYVGFIDLNPNNLALSNLGLFHCDYSVDCLKRDYEVRGDSDVFLKVLNIKVTTWPLSVPGAKLSHIGVVKLLKGEE